MVHDELDIPSASVQLARGRWEGGQQRPADHHQVILHRGSPVSLAWFRRRQGGMVAANYVLNDFSIKEHKDLPLPFGSVPTLWTTSSCWRFTGLSCASTPAEPVHAVDEVGGHRR